MRWKTTVKIVGQLGMALWITLLSTIYAYKVIKWGSFFGIDSF